MKKRELSDLSQDAAVLRSNQRQKDLERTGAAALAGRVFELERKVEQLLGELEQAKQPCASCAPKIVQLERDLEQVKQRPCSVCVSRSRWLERELVKSKKRSGS